MRAILFAVADDHTGNRITAAEAEKGNKFFCRLCNGEMILRKSGNVGKGAKRPHFAHKALTPNCTPESALHFEFKNLLFDRIERDLRSGLPLDLAWTCSYCHETHKGNLLRLARAAAVEAPLDACRPDIVLFNEKRSPIVAIEVVVTHKPGETVRNYYREKSIVLVELHLTSELDLENIERKLADADHVQFCFDRKRCATCGHFAQPILLRIIDSNCYRCKTEMLVPFIEGDPNRGSHIGPERFTQWERKQARDNGVSIEWRYSRTLNTSYWATTCGSCKSFIGRNHLFTGYIVPAGYGGAVITDHPLGQYCEYCAYEAHKQILADAQLASDFYAQ